MKLFLVSGNKHKFNEIKKKLAKKRIELKWKKASLNESPNQTLEETAIEKAEQAFNLVNAPVITEDTGVFFEAFENFPGAKAKRVFEEIGLKGLLERVKGKERRARFETVICFTKNGKKSECFKGVLRGKLDKKIHNPKKDVLPYEKIFVPNGFNQTLSSISREEKNSFSHRAKAVKKLAEWLKENIE